MSFLCGGSGQQAAAPPPPPPPPPAPPTAASTAVKAAGDRQTRAAQGAAGQGFNGTLLTGPQGDSKPIVGKQTLGGTT